MHGVLLPLLLAVAAATTSAARGRLPERLTNVPEGGEAALLKAARLGRAEHVRLMLELTGVDAAAADDRGRTALHHAALSGSAAMAELLLNATGADVNAVDGDGHTPLYYAINGSHTRVALAMLDDFALDVSARDSGDDTALHWAARAGHSQLVSAILESAPALLNAEGGGGRTPLAIAVRNGHTDSAQRLLAEPGVQLRGALDSANVLHCAAAGGHAALVRAVLSVEETDVNARDAGDATALMAAVWAGHVEAADALLATTGVDVAARDVHGRTALMLAMEHEGTELLRLILASDGVDECATDSHGCAQRCVNNAIGYRCGCNGGHELAANGRNCTQVIGPRQAATADSGEKEPPAASCGGRVTGRKGTITSPNYPSNYGPSARCTWDIVAPTGHTVYLDFSHVEMECGYDYVEVQSVDAEGDTVEGHGKHCGSPLPDRIASTTGHLRLVLRSDSSNQRSGFAAKYFIAKCAGSPTEERHADCLSVASGGGGDVTDCLRPPTPARSPYMGGL